MGQESELQRLERFVAKLLTNFSELREEKAILVQQLDERTWAFGGLGSRGLLYHALLGRELAAQIGNSV